MFWVGVFTQPLLMHLLVVQVQVNMLVHMVHRAHRQPVVRSRIVLGQLDVVAVHPVHHPVILSVGALDWHVFPDLVCLCHAPTVLAPPQRAMKESGKTLHTELTYEQTFSYTAV